MSTDELGFENRLEVLASDGRSCARFVYTALALEHLAAQDGELREGMQADADFWQAVLTGLRTAGVAALDRLYDEDRNTGSAARALRFAERHKPVFSRARLEARRRAAGLPSDAGTGPTSFHELQPGDLAGFFGELDRMRRAYAAAVGPLRERILEDPAEHAGFSGRFGNDCTKRLEQLAVFALRVHRALYRLYFDGREPTDEDVPTAIADVLAAPADQEWPHCRAAWRAARFARARRVRMPPRGAGQGQPEAPDGRPAEMHSHRPVARAQEPVPRPQEAAPRAQERQETAVLAPESAQAAGRSEA